MFPLAGLKKVQEGPVKASPPPDRFKRLSHEEMAQRRLEGLCFKQKG